MNKLKIIFYCVLVAAISGSAFSDETPSNLESVASVQRVLPEGASIAMLVAGGVGLVFARCGVKK